jgi:hypothetical protein
MDYESYIGTYEANTPFLRGKCREACLEMVKTFPELSIRRGHVITSEGRFSHWWLVTPGEVIVDPTAKQFFGWIYEYIEWTPDEPVQVGKCMHCAEPIMAVLDCLDSPSFKYRDFCSNTCEADMARHLNEYHFLAKDMT